MFCSPSRPRAGTGPLGSCSLDPVSVVVVKYLRTGDVGDFLGTRWRKGWLSIKAVDTRTASDYLETNVGLSRTLLFVRTTRCMWLQIARSLARYKAVRRTAVMVYCCCCVRYLHAYRTRRRGLDLFGGRHESCHTQRLTRNASRNTARDSSSIVLVSVCFPPS